MSRLLLLLATFNLFYNECIGTAVPTSGDNGGVIAIGYENNTYGIIFPNVSIHQTLQPNSLGLVLDELVAEKILN